MTVVIDANDPLAARQAADVLARGDLVVIPTDTVYGVASRLDDTAIERLYGAKMRPIDKAIPILLASPDDVEQVALAPTSQEMRLMDAFWPGALTLVLPKQPNLPKYVSQLSTIGVRIPDHDITRAIIRAAGGALAVTSANRSGLPAVPKLQMALDQIGDSVALGIDGGTTPGQGASTVARIGQDNNIVILREGSISRHQLERALKG